MKINLEKEIYKENERIKIYSLYFNILNTNRRRLFISIWGNPNLHIISLFKATSIYFTKVTHIPFVN